MLNIEVKLAQHITFFLKKPEIRFIKHETIIIGLVIPKHINFDLQ